MSIHPNIKGSPRRRSAALLHGALLAGILLLTGCGVPLKLGQPGGMQALAVPEENYAVYEVDITEAGVYALSVIDLDPQVSNRQVDRMRTLTRIMDVLEPGVRISGTRSPIGTDTFDNLAGVIWAVYGRGQGSSAATPVGAPAAVTSLQAGAKASERAGEKAGEKPGPTPLGPRLMQSTERPLAEAGPRAPERARLEPGRYVVRVATAYGSQRTTADRVDVGLVRLADGNAAPGEQRIRAVPLGSAVTNPAPATPKP